MQKTKFILFNKIAITAFLLMLLQTIGFSQTANPGINFQAIARDKEHNAANNRKIYIECSIEKGLTNPVVVYGEHHNVMSNEFGVFNLVIGKGVPYTILKDIYGIDWANGKYYFHLKISITPVAPDLNWDYTKEWIDLGAVEFGVVPYAIQTLNGLDAKTIAAKLNIADTALMLLPYKNVLNDSSKYVTPYQLSLKSFDTSSLSIRINAKLNATDTSSLSQRINNKLFISDTATMLLPYHGSLLLKDSIKYVTPYQYTLKTFDTSSLSSRINTKLNSTDTIYLSNRINLKEAVFNKSIDINLVADNNDTKYPSVKAIKSYVDAALIAGAPDATTTNKGIILLAGDLEGSATTPTIIQNAISTGKLQDASVTDAKVAPGINASKVGLGSVTNNAQLYNLNGLTVQVQNFITPGTSGLAPNWVSVGQGHTLNIPLASSSSVTAGLISKQDYDRFTASTNNAFNSLSTNGNVGAAVLNGQVLNIPNYTLVGLAGSVNANTIFAGPINGVASSANFRTLVSADIPNNAANTTGNATTATGLLNPVLINGVSFNGLSDITIAANTANNISFNNLGTGAGSPTSFNGAIAKTISYNTVGAAPTIGSTAVTTLGTITTGNWNANIIGANYGGAGNINGILKANGLGVVTAAVLGTDFQNPLSFTAPLINNASTISMPQANAFNSGYLLNTDWTIFNNKIDLSLIGVPNGVASLDGNGKIPASQIPSISFSSGYVVSSQSAMLALSVAVVGSIAIRTDNSKNYVLSGLPSSSLSNWLELLMPVSVTSVNGHAESNITLTTTDISEGTNLYYTSTRARNAISASSPMAYNNTTGVFSLPVASTLSAGYLSASDWNIFNNKIGSFAAQAANVFYAGPSSGGNAVPTFRGIAVNDVPVLNQNTTGNAATATKFATPRNINGVAFDGTSDITIAATVANALIINSSGLGLTSPVSFDGSATKTISYNSVGAAPTIGSSAITTLGTITTGTWQGNIIDASHGGAGNINGVLKANGLGVVTAAVLGTDFESPLTFSVPLARSANTISLSAATTSNNGYLTASDWNLFNSKQSSVIAGTGVTVTGSNTVSIGQTVAITASPLFAGITLSGLNVAGIVTNTASGLLSTTTTTGTGPVVRANSPTLVTPILGDATATTLVASGDITAKRFKLTMPTAITAATTTTIDLSGGNVFTVNLGLNVTTLTLTNGVVGTYLIKFVQDATGTRDVTFPVAWKWAGGVVPNLTNTAGKTDIVTLIYDGTTYYTTIVQNF